MEMGYGDGCFSWRKGQDKWNRSKINLPKDGGVGGKLESKVWNGFPLAKLDLHKIKPHRNTLIIASSFKDK